MKARNSANSADCNLIRANSTANACIIGDSSWGSLSIQGPGVSLVTGGITFSVGTTGVQIANGTGQGTFAFTAAVTASPNFQHTAAAGSVALVLTGSSPRRRVEQLDHRTAAHSSCGAAARSRAADERAGSSWGWVGLRTDLHVEIAQVVTSLRVVSLCRGAVLTSTHMPASSGDGVINLCAAATAPTASPDASGIIVYASATALITRNSSGRSDFGATSLPHQVLGSTVKIIGRNNANSADWTFLDWNVTTTNGVTIGDGSNTQILSFRQTRQIRACNSPARIAR